VKGEWREEGECKSNLPKVVLDGEFSPSTPPLNPPPPPPTQFSSPAPSDPSSSKALRNRSRCSGSSQSWSSSRPHQLLLLPSTLLAPAPWHPVPRALSGDRDAGVTVLPSLLSFFPSSLPNLVIESPLPLRRRHGKQDAHEASGSTAGAWWTLGLPTWRAEEAFGDVAIPGSATPLTVVSSPCPPSGSPLGRAFGASSASRSSGDPT
jgi:hypothetical protein